MAGAKSRREAPVLLGIDELTRRPIDDIFEFVAAGLTRPHVSNAAIGKMLGPFRCDQTRTTLRALVPGCTFHWPLPTPAPYWRGHPKIKTAWQDKDRSSAAFRQRKKGSATRSTKGAFYFAVEFA
jgi:hypothetical protein